MDLLIPGLILVALMVYASTRIKRSAAQAFEPETVETDEFVIAKPEGFLNVLNGDPQYAFEAYSKDFGDEEEKSVRAATVHLKVYPDIGVEDRVNAIAGDGFEKINDIAEVIGDVHYRLIEGRRTDAKSPGRIFYKLAERRDKTFELKVDALDSVPETMRRAEALLDSFEIK
jgi:hypothetical protein